MRLAKVGRAQSKARIRPNGAIGYFIDLAELGLTAEFGTSVCPKCTQSLLFAQPCIILLTLGPSADEEHCSNWRGWGRDFWSSRKAVATSVNVDRHWTAIALF